MVALEGLHECLGHAVALGAFDRREARLEVQGRGNLKGAIGGEDGSVVSQPLHLAWSPDVAEPLLDTMYHHVPDHLAGDPSRCGHPANDLAVMAVQGKGNPHDLAIPAGELQRVRTPTLIGSACHDGPVVGPWDTAPCMPGQQQAAFLHQPVDALGVDRIVAGGSPLALEERGDPPVSVAWPGVHKAPDIASELLPARVWGPRFARLPLARSTRLERATPRVSAIRFTGYPPDAAIATARSFFSRARSRASLRISTSMVLRP